MNRYQKCVVLLSGGMDSTTLLVYCKKYFDTVFAVSFDYGQRHRHRELDAARRIASYYNVPHDVFDLSDINTAMRSALTSPTDDIPEGHYTDQSMKATVVPNRNMIMLSIATAFAISAEYDAVAYAAHAGDHAIYPDCRPEFANAMRGAMFLCSDLNVELITPFINDSKADIARKGAELKVPYELTYSCYNGREKHCGRCGTCVERKEAFELSGASDKTEYED